MDQTILLTVKSYEFDAGVNQINPLGYRMRISTKEDERFRMYFFSPDEAVPKLVGWRALDGALVLFLRPRDYDSFVLLLDQAKATYIKVMLVGKDGDEDITLFELSSAPFLADTQLEDSDRSEFEKRAARTTIP